MPNAAARMGKRADVKAAGSKAFGLLLDKRVVVTLKPEDDDDKHPPVYEGVLRSFDDDRLILEDKLEYTPVEIASIDTCNLKK